MNPSNNDSSSPLATTTTTTTTTSAPAAVNSDINKRNEKDDEMNNDDDSFDMDSNNNNNNNNNNNSSDKVTFSLPSIRPSKEEEEDVDKKDPANRYAPYKQKTNLSFEERLDMVELIINMFPLLEKDPDVYNILHKNGWDVEACLGQFQNRHEMAERKLEESKNIVDHSGGGGDGLSPIGKQRTTGGLSYMDKYPHPTSTREDYEKELEEMEEEESESEDERIMGSIGGVDPSTGEKSALDFSNFPNLRSDLQTLKDIFGTTYHEFELKSIYMVCGGNVEVVIDQLVNEQRLKDNKNNNNNNNNKNNNNNNNNNNSISSNSLGGNNYQPPPPTQKESISSITARLSEAEKRQLQLQLIEEQEKLEKNFSDKKQKEINAHPSKINFSQQEIVNELKDLFSKNVDDGVIEWVAYSCEYDLAKSVTQLVELKHNNLMKKGAIKNPFADPSVNMNIANNLDVLAKQMMSSMGASGSVNGASSTQTTPTNLVSQISFDSLVDEVQSKLSSADDTPINNKNNTTTTTTTTTKPFPFGSSMNQFKDNINK